MQLPITENDIATPKILPFRHSEPERAAFALPPLPVPVSALIGRDRDIDQIVALINQPETRLVTITGPGGIGKTRLAIAAATRLAADFPGGAGFVPLAHLRDAALIAPAVAANLKIQRGGAGSLLDQIATALGRTRTLLVFDNFEQVLGAASFIIQLLTVCPALCIAVTSRARLNVRGEREFRLAPLEIAAGDEAEFSPAVALFVERATEANPRFSVDEPRLRLIGEICRDLDGMPLAIELAAARCRVLPPEAMRPLIHRRLEFLTGGPRDAPQRQQTLRDTIRWTYELLPEREQRLFRLLSVFPAGFTLDAAIEVARAGGYLLADDDPTLALLAGTETLCDFSLLRPAPLDDPADGNARFGLFETIREFGYEQLSQHGKVESAYAGLVAWCGHLHAHVEPSNRGDGYDEFAFLEQEIPNLRTAIAWLRDRGEAQAGLRLLQPLAWFLTQRFRLDEAVEWVDSLLALSDAQSDPAEYADALNSAAKIRYWHADFVRTVDLLEESLLIARSLGEERRIAETLFELANAQFDAGNVARASALVEESAALFGTSGNALGRAIAGALIARIALEAGEHASALKRYRESLAVFEALRQRTWVAFAHESIGLALLELNDVPGAEAALRQSLTMAGELSDRWRCACCFTHLGEVAGRRGKLERAAMLLGAGAAQRATMGIVMRPATDRKIARWTARVHERLGAERFDRSWEFGAALSRDQALAIALDNAPVPKLTSAADPTPAAGIVEAHGLTPRELDVLRLICEGLGNREIGDRLYISHRTVMQHVANILAKIDVTSRTAAAAWAHRHGVA